VLEHARESLGVERRSLLGDDSASSNASFGGGGAQSPFALSPKRRGSRFLIDAMGSQLWTAAAGYTARRFDLEAEASSDTRSPIPLARQSRQVRAAWLDGDSLSPLVAVRLNDGERELLAGTIPVGHSWRTDLELGAALPIAKAARLKPFLHASRGRSVPSPALSTMFWDNSWDSARTGADWALGLGALGGAQFGLEGSASLESAHRNPDLASYRRTHARLSSIADWHTHPVVEASAAATVELFRDQDEELQPLWEASGEVSSSRQHALGVSVRGKRFARFPTAVARFGDGALLGGNPTLPTESGHRVSLGPWWESKFNRSSINGELHAFLEESRNAPLQVATSPVGAKTLPVGGIWSQGAVLKSALTWETGRWELGLVPSVTLQDTVNASLVNWQTGRRVPGRPTWTTAEALSLTRGRTTFTLRHQFQSPAALDLADSWKRPSLHDLSIALRYSWRNGAATIKASHLIAPPAEAQSDWISGRAAENILEPFIGPSELRAACEFYL